VYSSGKPKRSLAHTENRGPFHVTSSSRRAFAYMLLADHGAPEKLTGEKSMEMSFFALPSQQGPVQGRFKPAHLPISLSTRVTACVRRFETPTPLSYARTESKKDIPMLFIAFLSGITLKQRSGSCAKGEDPIPVSSRSAPSFGPGLRISLGHRPEARIGP